MKVFHFLSHLHLRAVQVLRAVRAEQRRAFRRSRSGRSNTCMICLANHTRCKCLMLIGKTPFRKFQRLIGDCSPALACGASVVALLALLAMTLGLVACLPLGLAAPTETPPATETPSPSETIVWFPPSATATHLSVPTHTATPEMNPGVGRVILKDNFSDENVWDIATSDSGSASIHRNRLTLAVQPGYYLASMRRELPLSDFYAEITARPSLCRGE